MRHLRPLSSNRIPYPDYTYYNSRYVFYFQIICVLFLLFKNTHINDPLILQHLSVLAQNLL